jgi:hypothetical protein
MCWLRLDFVPLSVVLGALGPLRLLSILIIHSVCCPRPCRLYRLVAVAARTRAQSVCACVAMPYPDAGFSMTGTAIAAAQVDSVCTATGQ